MATPHLIKHKCIICDSSASKRCSACNQAWYCSKEHQIKDWKRGHKKQCKINQQNSQTKTIQSAAANTNDTNNVLMTQTDIVQLILSFLAHKACYDTNKFCFSPIYGMSAYMRLQMTPRGMFDEETCFHSWNVLPLSWKLINKAFNESVSRLCNIIISIQTNININKLSSFPNCNYLKQLYLIQDLSSMNETEIKLRNDSLNSMQFPNLKILQIHYNRNWEKTLDISLNKNNFPRLLYLILGTIHNDEFRQMRINKLNLDLNIKELRIQYCSFTDNGLDSLSLSIAKCPLIHNLWLLFQCFDDNDEQDILLKSLYLPSMKKAFIQSNKTATLTMYAPKLELIQFYFCDILDKFMLLSQIPNEWKSYLIDSSSGSKKKKKKKLQIGFDNTHEELYERHVPKFTVIKNGKRYNEKCDIKWSAACREMLEWPFDTYE
eukprot:33104_1